MIDRRQENSHNYLNMIMDASPNLIAINDGHKIFSANRSLLDFLGFESVEEFLQHYECIGDLFVKHNKDALGKQEGAETWYQYVLHSPNKKLAYMYKDKSLHVYKIHVGKMSVQEQTMYVAIFNEVTELELQKERYTQAIEGSQVGLWDMNLKENSVFFSPYWKAMLGYEDHEIPNDFASWRDNVHPDDLEGAMEAIQANIDGKTNFYHNIHRLRHKDGYWVYIEDRGKTFFDSDGKPSRMVGTHTDITAAKKSEALNILYKERAETLLLLPKLSDSLSERDFMQAALVKAEKLTNSKISFIHFVNDDEKTIELVTWSDATLDDYCTAVHESHYPSSQAGLWAEALRQKKAITYNNYEQASGKKGLPKGHASLERFISLPVIEDDKVVMLCGVGNKAGEYTAMEEESLQLIANETWRLIQAKRNRQKINEAQEMLMVQSRHAAMGEMMSMIAHQWRQPISIIEMCINNILLDLELDELNTKELQTQLKDMVSQTHYLSHTIDDFRDFFRPNKSKETIQINEVIKNALTLMTKSLEVHGIKIEYEENDTLKMHGHTKELLQVFLNILNNAKEALIQNRPKNPQISIELKSSKSDIHVSITDNAGGINPKLIHKVFDPYFSTKNQKDGTGLGLYMSKIIVEKHLYGKIKASNTQEGACLEIILPKPAPHTS